MRKRAPLIILTLYLCTACSSARYIEHSEEPRNVQERSADDTGSKPASTFVPVKAKDIPAFTDPLTGLNTNESVVNSRPVAVVINNHHKALPQSGIGQAAICYEVLAEGNITRIIAIFHDFDTQKIGPVRSARHYFLDFAMDYDAIFVHHGGSPQAYDALEETGIAALDGMKLSETFWRDPERANVPGMFEHSSYTGEELIRQARERFEFRPEMREGLNAGFLFYDEQTVPAESAGAAFISVAFAQGYESSFEYLDGLYYISTDGKPRIDAETNERLSVENLLIQYAPVKVIAGDTAGRRDVDVVGEGEGLFITNGGSVPLIWKKDSHETPTRWYNKDGSDLYFNRGKTWICVVSPDTAVSIE
ncbi:MAG: DUF3048 domain-containing protein [Clostridiales bacterium]|jgi:hypothetical protein|nr:DUF3048 domain-containing protein [Clostridiales bacterium]